MATTSLRDSLRLAEVDLAARKTGEALHAAEQLLVVHPHWLEAQRVRAEALIALDRLPEAEQMLDGILSCHPEHVRSFVNRAYLMQRRNDLLGMLAYYRRACELTAQNVNLRAIHNQIAGQLNRPPYTPSHTGLARLYLRAELFPQAIREWDIALQVNPNRLDAQIGMAETLWRMGSARRAQDVCLYILHRMDFCLKPLLLMTLFSLDQGNTSEAQNYVTRATALDPEQLMAADLFSDLVANGHAALANLFRHHARSLTSPLTASAVEGKRSFTEPLSTGQLNTGPLFATTTPNMSSTGKLPKVSEANEQIDLTQPLEDYFARSRAKEMPHDFRKIFQETEYMLWSRDNEEPITVETPVTPESQSASNGVPALPSSTTATSAAGQAEHDFLTWLQAQGARPLSANEPEPTTVPARDEVLPKVPADPDSLPPFLRQALAEQSDQDKQPEATINDDLGHWNTYADPTQQPPVIAEPIYQSSVTEQPTVMTTPSQPPVIDPVHVAPPINHALTSSATFDTPSPAHESSQPEPMTVPIETVPPAAIPESVSPQATQVAQSEHREQQSVAPAAADKPRQVTMEGIEQGLQSVGFARLDTGRLSSLSTVEPPAATTVDVPTQLAHARSLRQDRRIGESLSEYRTLVKSSTDDLDMIIRDLRDAAIEEPNEPEIHRLLGDAYIRMGDYLEALESYNRSSSLRTEKSE